MYKARHVTWDTAEDQIKSGWWLKQSRDYAIRPLASHVVPRLDKQLLFKLHAGTCVSDVEYC